MKVHRQGVFVVDFSSHTYYEEERKSCGRLLAQRSGNDQALDASESEKGSDLGLLLTGNTGATRRGGRTGSVELLSKNLPGTRPSVISDVTAVHSHRLNTHFQHRMEHMNSGS